MVGQQFTTTDVLRLEVEADPAGLENLIQNPNGDLGGWGWVTPVVGSTMVGGASLTYTSPTPAAASWFYSESIPIAAGQWVAASWIAAAVTGYHRARFEFLDGAGAVLSSSVQTGYLAASPGRRTTAAYQAPASTQSVRLRFDHYSTTGGANPAAGAQLSMSQVTVAQAATSAALITSRTNHVPNPSFETATSRWYSSAQVIARSSAQAYSGAWSLALTHPDPGHVREVHTGTIGDPSISGVEPGRVYTLSAWTRGTTSRRVRLTLTWLDSTGATISTAAAEIDNSTSQWLQVAVTAAAPATASLAQITFSTVGNVDAGETHYLDAVMFEPAASAGDYFDGSTADAAGWDYSWTGTAHNSTSTAVLSSLAYIPPTEWLSILGPTHEIRVQREELNLGTIEGTIYDATLDPAQADTLRPGRKLRLTTYADGTGWEPVITGDLRRAKVTYDPLDTSNKRARIEFFAVDNTGTLANHRRSEGVETIDELPYVLEGCGVPWNVNGSGDQVPTATVVALNESATAADQVALTRDSSLGRAWVDRQNIVQVWDAAQLDTTMAATLDESAYSDLSIDYDTERCINYVTVKVIRIGATGETEETTYGPYTDDTSIATWGVRAEEFTVQWADADEAAASTFAAAILAANSTPVVRINSVTIPIRSEADLSAVAGQRRALLDLCDLVTASNANTGVTSQTRITKLSHSITGAAWSMALEFATEGSVAAPQETPPPPSRVSDWWPEVRMLHGAKALCPVNFLVMDGGAFSTTEYPELAAHLTALGLPSGVLPDYTDRFPIGAGAKALGTSGGGPTKVIAEANLPPHQHNAGTLVTGSAGGHTHGVARRSAAGTTGGTSMGSGTTQPDIATDNPGGHTHPITGSTANGAGASTPLDVMNPWRAIYFVIRAR